MTDTVNYKAIRDSLVNCVAKAINTGAKARQPLSPRDQAFFAGKVAGCVNAAAICIEQVYGGNFERVQRRLNAEVRLIRQQWSTEERLDAAKVGQEATVILDMVLALSKGRSLADLIIDNGPFVAGGAMPPELRHPTANAFNDLRDELMAGRVALTLVQANEVSE